MRRHENIGYSAFNTYRSGDENSRQYDYGNPEAHSRGGRSVYGQSSRDNEASDRLYSTSSGFGSASRNESQYPSGSSQYGQRNQGRSGQGWTSQSPSSNQYRSQGSGSSDYSPSGSYGSGQSSNYGSSYGSSGPSGYGASNRDSSDYGYRSSDRDNSWADRTGNRMENWADRTGNRLENWADRAGNQVDRWGDRISNAWDRATDDDNRNRSNRGWTGQGSNQGSHNYYSHGNAGQNRYSDSYENPYSGSYSSQYEPRSSGYRRYEENRGRHEDEGGFFDHLGNRISNAWDRWIGNDEDEQRRYENRSHYRSSGNTSDRDYNW